MKNELLEDVRLKLVKHFLDVIVLETILRQGPLSGYDFMEDIHVRFDFMVSSGTVYSLLYQLEREGLVEGKMTIGKRVYALTQKGKVFINSILESKKEILGFVENIFTGQ